jgi:hypothetical protein
MRPYHPNGVRHSPRGCGIGLLNTHHSSLRTSHSTYRKGHNVDLYTKPSFYIHPRTEDRRANLTEFMLARVIIFVGMSENLVGDRGSIFPPIHGRPCATIKGQTCDVWAVTKRCGIYSLESTLCAVVNFQQDDSARQLLRAQFTYIRSINLRSHFTDKKFFYTCHKLANR